jgi:hypothetical protein
MAIDRMIDVGVLGIREMPSAVFAAGKTARKVTCSKLNVWQWLPTDLEEEQEV